MYPSSRIHMIRVLGVVLFLSATAITSHGQNCGPVPSSARTYEDFVRWCSGRGTLRQIGGDRQQCDCGNNTQTSSGNDRNASDAAERNRIEAERLAAEEARKREEEEKAEAMRREEREAKEKFERDKSEAIESLKGVAASELDLKEAVKDADTIKDRSTDSFGLKGVGVSDTGIKDLKPGNETRDLSTASKQVCGAAEITNYVLKAASKPSPDLEETRYLATEALRALAGERMGIKLDKPSSACDKARAELLGKMLPSYKAALQSVVAQIDRIQADKKQAAELKVKTTAAKDQVAPDPQPKEQVAPSPKQSATPAAATPSRSADDEKIAKALAEQRAFQEAEKKRIEHIYRKQKEDETQLAAALAKLREMQKQINEDNQKKP
jgi:hypothetical protein